MAVFALSWAPSHKIRSLRETRGGSPVIQAACWAHGRRKLFDIAKLTKAPIAVEAVRRIDEIFAVERTINGRSPAERVAARQQQSKPLILDLEIYLREQRMLLSAMSDTAKGITYILSRWVAFTRFLDDGRICMSNGRRSARCDGSPSADGTGRSAARTPAAIPPLPSIR